VLTRGGICVPPTATYLPYRVSGSTLTAFGRSQLLARWPETHFRILSGIVRAAQTVLSVYLTRTCSRITDASSALGVLTGYALGLYKSTHSLFIMCKNDAVDKKAEVYNTCRNAARENQITRTRNLVKCSSFGDMLADRQKHRQTDIETGI